MPSRGRGPVAAAFDREMPERSCWFLLLSLISCSRLLHLTCHKAERAPSGDKSMAKMFCGGEMFWLLGGQCLIACDGKKMTGSTLVTFRLDFATNCEFNGSLETSRVFLSDRSSLTTADSPMLVSPAS